MYNKHVNLCIVCPRVIRVDKGTENTLIYESQIAIRLHGVDSLSGIKSIYGLAHHLQTV